MAFWKDSMINRLSNIINRNRSAAKISQVLCSSLLPLARVMLLKDELDIYFSGEVELVLKWPV